MNKRKTFVRYSKIQNVLQRKSKSFIVNSQKQEFKRVGSKKIVS
jgi:hypothetical protein